MRSPLSPGLSSLWGGDAKALDDAKPPYQASLYSPTREERSQLEADEMMPLSPAPENGGKRRSEDGDEDEAEEVGCVKHCLDAWWAALKAFVVYLAFWCNQFLVKGEWVDTEENEGFVDRYEPLFGNYVFFYASYFFVAFELIRKLLEALVLGTMGWWPEGQVGILIILRMTTVVHLILVRPFVDRIENLVQVIVLGQETAFLAALYSFTGQEGTDEWLGAFLNYLNMGGMGVLIANSMGRQLLENFAGGVEFIYTSDICSMFEVEDIARALEAVDATVVVIADAGIPDEVGDAVGDGAAAMAEAGGSAWNAARDAVVANSAILAGVAVGAYQMSQAEIDAQLMEAATDKMEDDVKDEHAKQGGGEWTGGGGEEKGKLPNQPLSPGLMRVGAAVAAGSVVVGGRGDLALHSPQSPKQKGLLHFPEFNNKKG